MEASNLPLVWSELFTGVVVLLELETLSQEWPCYMGNGQNHEFFFFARHCIWARVYNPILETSNLPLPIKCIPGAVSPWVQRMHLHPLKSGCGCNAPVLRAIIGIMKVGKPKNCLLKTQKFRFSTNSFQKCTCSLRALEPPL